MFSNLKLRLSVCGSTFAFSDDEELLQLTFYSHQLLRLINPRRKTATGVGFNYHRSQAEVFLT
jgi:hypothetical protein